MTGEEWAFSKRFILAHRSPSGSKVTSPRQVLGGVF